MIYVPQSISSSIFIFAGDTKLICAIQSIADHILLQADLDCLLKWCDRWQVNFNISKCKLPYSGKIWQGESLGNLANRP